jgi:hypothetical protein
MGVGAGERVGMGVKVGAGAGVGVGLAVPVRVGVGMGVGVQESARVRVVQRRPQTNPHTDIQAFSCSSYSQRYAVAFRLNIFRKIPAQSGEWKNVAATAGREWKTRD